MLQYRRRLFLGLLLCAGTVAPARADFMPGHIYLSAEHHQGSNFGKPRIYEFDPVTGRSSIFAEIDGPFSSSVIKLQAFTPDYSKLRIISFAGDAVLEMNGTGGFNVALTAADGLYAPWSSSYAANGDHYIFQTGFFQPAILRFPGGTGPADIFAQYPDYPYLQGLGPVEVSSNGHVYYGVTGMKQIHQFTPDGQGALFATLPTAIVSIETGLDGIVYVGAHDGIYRIDPDNPSSPTLLAPLGFQGLAIAPDGHSLYSTGGSFVRQIDLATGEVTVLGSISIEYPWFLTGGPAVYVPEPTALTAFLFGAGLCNRSRRRGR